MDLVTMNITEFIIAANVKNLEVYQFYPQNNTISKLLKTNTIALPNSISKLACESYFEFVYCVIDTRSYQFTYVILESTYLNFDIIDTTTFSLLPSSSSTNPVIKTVIDNTIMALCGTSSSFIVCHFKNRTTYAQIGPNAVIRDCNDDTLRSIIDWKSNMILLGCSSSDLSKSNFIELKYTGFGFALISVHSYYPGQLQFFYLTSDVFVILINHNNSPKMIFHYTPICKNMIIRGALGNSNNFIFLKPSESKEDEFIFFPILDYDITYGDLLDDKSSNAVINIQYDISKDFIFKAKAKKGTTTLKYKIQMHNNNFFELKESTTCEVTFDLRCYESCLTCSGIETRIDHKCKVCNTGYYKYLDNASSNCYNELTKLNSNWYLNPDDNLYYHCSDGCIGCTANQETIKVGDIISYKTHCKDCKNGFYPYKTKEECRNSNFKEDNIYFDYFQEEYFDCYPNCKACTFINDTLSMNCLSCISAKTMNGDTNNCISLTPPAPNYCKGQYDDYYKCYRRCSTCNVIGSDSANNCLSCNPPDYLVRQFNICVTESEAKRDYTDSFVDTTNRIVIPCYLSCDKCDGDGTLTSHFCITCKRNYYKVKGKQNCYSTLEKPDGFFLNSASTKEWEACDSTCLTCLKKTECFSCKNNEFLYKGKCYPTCPVLNYIYNGACVTECPIGSTLVANECFDLYESSSDNILVTDLKKEDLISILETNLPQFSIDSNIIKGKDYLVQVYDKKSEEDNKKRGNEYKLTTCNPDLCLFQLASYYNLNEEDIIIVKIDLNVTASPINDVEFIFYDHHNVRLDNVLHCKDADIPVSFPIIDPSGIKIKIAQGMTLQGYDSFKANDPFFNSLCTPFTSTDNLDVTLRIRRETFYQNISFCHSGCIYDSTNMDALTVKCNCNNRNDEASNKIINEFNENFYSQSIYLLSCYKQVFDSKIIGSNAGFWVLFIFIIGKASLSIYIAIRGFYQYTLWLKLPMNSPPKKIDNKMISNLPMKKKRNEDENSIDMQIAMINMRLNRPQNNDIQIEDIADNNNNNELKIYEDPLQNHFEGIGDYQQNDNEKGNKQLEQCSTNKKIETDQSLNRLTTLQLNKLMKTIAEDDDDLSLFIHSIFQYKEEIDKPIENIFIICYSFIKIKHPLFNVFIYPVRYEFFLFNILLFFNSRGIECGLNALFYFTSYIEEKYNNKGIINYGSILLKSIFACLVTYAIGALYYIFISPSKESKAFILKEYCKARKRLRLEHYQKELPSNYNTFQSYDKNNNNNEQQKIIQINHSHSHNKNKEDTSRVVIDPETHKNNINNCTERNMIHFKSFDTIKDEFDDNVEKIILRSKIKLIIFTVINSLIMLFLWYYAMSFCAVYKNSQVDWIIGCIISIGISIIFPFILTIIFGVIKWIALKCRCETLYVFNDFINNIL